MSEATLTAAAAVPATATVPAGVLVSRDATSGEELGRVRLSTVGTVARASRRAAAAQRDWAARPGQERAEVLLRAADLLEGRLSQAMDLLVRESGSITGKAWFEVGAAVGELRHAASLAVAEHVHRVPDPDPGREAVVRRVPLGVVGVIVPWNFPLLLGMRSVAPALALGNAVLLKPDPHTPLSGGVLFAEVLTEAGLPDDLLAVLHGDADAGLAVIEAPDVSMVSFTGSTEAGQQVGAACGRLLKRVVLELGGHNAFVVTADADPEEAASAGSWGAFLHQGQICMSARRHLVHQDLVEAYTEALARHAAALRIGDPRDGSAQIGPLIDGRQLNRVAAAVEQAVAQGARLVTGGVPDAPYYPPTVLADVTPRMDVFHREVFGPVATVTAFRDDDEAVELANDSDYGLTAAVHTGSPEHGRALAERLRCGVVHVGDQTVNHDPKLPFGGVGASGNAAGFGGPAALEAFTRWHTLTVSVPSRSYPF